MKEGEEGEEEGEEEEGEGREEEEGGEGERRKKRRRRNRGRRARRAGLGVRGGERAKRRVAQARALQVEPAETGRAFDRKATPANRGTAGLARDVRGKMRLVTGEKG